MDYWRRSDVLRKQAWDYLENLAQVDIALLQESNPIGQGKHFLSRDLGILDERKNPPKNLGWGSSIVSYGPKINKIEFANSPFSKNPIPVLRTFPGSVAIAELEIVIQ